MKKRFSIWAVVALMAGSTFIGMGISQLISSDNIYQQIKKFNDVLSFTEKYYVEDVDIQKLTEAAVNGMLNTLDPHSIYIPAKAFEQVQEQFKGKFEGIGVSFRVINDTITVLDIVGGGPSAKLGILSNDKIVKINDSLAIGFTSERVMGSLRGAKGTKVKVTIIRPGVKEPLLFEIIRDEISIASVEAAIMYNDQVGYVNVARFSEPTHAELERALRKLHEQGMKYLILDLRLNPGGYLEEAVKMADMFLDGGTREQPKKIVFTKARRPELEQAYFAKSGDEYEKLPLIILINNASASASEIVAGAIQDWDRGLVAGETSFGKGLVQQQWRLTDGSAVRLTIAKYYTPSGRLIQRSYEGKEKEQYQREAFERKEQEGENIEHKLEVKADSLKPVFHTISGRVVYGGGGITPDYIVKPANFTALYQNMWRRNLFFDFIKQYLEGPGLDLRAKYGKDKISFKRSFQISDEFLAEFKSFVEKKGVTVEEKEFQKDREFIKTRLKAEIAGSLWGAEGGWFILLDSDPQFQKAISLFPEAAKIAGLK